MYMIIIAAALHSMKYIISANLIRHVFKYTSPCYANLD